MLRRFWLACLVGLSCHENPSEPERGDLRVVVSGLPTGALGAVLVTGPGLSQTLTFTATLTSLEPGSYVVTAASVVSNGVTFSPSRASQTVAVSARTLASVTVDYAAAANKIALGFETVSHGAHESRLRRVAAR